MTDSFDYDPERALWKPGRRKFIVVGGLALAGTMIGDRMVGDGLISPTRGDLVGPYRAGDEIVFRSTREVGTILEVSRNGGNTRWVVRRGNSTVLLTDVSVDLPLNWAP